MQPEPDGAKRPNHDRDSQADAGDRGDSRVLKAEEAMEAARRLGELGRTGMPLAEGLRAVAAEHPGTRLSRLFSRMATESEGGKSLDVILEERRRSFPSHVVGLIKAAGRTDRLVDSLSSLVEQDDRMREMKRLVAGALAYPMIVVAMAFISLLLLQLVVLNSLSELFEDVDVPFLTKALLWWADEGVAIFLFLGIAVVMGLLTLRLVAGRALWRRMIATVPLLGAIWHWSGVAQWSRLLGLLVAHEVPLPEALRLAADGSFDRNVGQVSRQLAVGAEQGRRLSDMLATTHRLPASLRPLAVWGETSGDLAGALEAAAEMLEGRVRVRAGLIRLITPPLALIMVGAGILLVVLAVAVPAYRLIDQVMFFF